MAFTELYCNTSTGSNLNGGSDSGSPSMSDTAGTGSWTSTTNTYVSVATNGAVAVGQFMSIYSSGATVAAYTARITAVSGGSGSVWTITLSSTAFSGSVPTTGIMYLAQVGGAWKGPNAASGFPFGYITNALTNSTGNPPRVSLLNAATYSVTANIAASKSGPIIYQGATSTPGDGGFATISGGTSGASYVVLTASGNEQQFSNLIFSNNGATGSVDLVDVSGSCVFINCVFSGSVGNGVFASGFTAFSFCEAYGNNTANATTKGGFNCQNGNYTVFQNCISHDNTGTNTAGFFGQGTIIAINCISDTNGGIGFVISNGTNEVILSGCSVYNNTSDGLKLNSSSGNIGYIHNCIFASNGGYGVNMSVAGQVLNSYNCAFYNNTSGQININVTGISNIIGSITLSGSPFNDGPNGDFSLNNTAGAGAACRATGIGAFTQVSGDGYTKTTTSYPDVGAAQVSDTGGGGGASIYIPVQQFII